MATVNNTAWAVEEYGEEEGFAVDYLPSMRMIVDLSDLTQSVSINTTGQSGHPFIDNYNDMIDLYRNIEYHDMMWSRGQVEAATVDKLLLKPGE
jgi:penicillin amidase